jgi:hypothetical protein
MSDPLIATQADYADSLLTARLAKNWCFLILLILLLGQMGLFFVVRYGKVDLVTGPGINRTQDILHYAIGLCGYLGLVTTIVYAVLLLLILNIMVVGRLLGTGKLTAAFVWCVLLGVILFPWQAFLNNAGLQAGDFKIPGVLYVWAELVEHARFKVREGDKILWAEAILKWARFVGFPLVAILIDVMIQAKSVKGLRRALGEDLPPVTPAAEAV